METLTAYNSIHDGPAIDAAVTRASEGGAIDAAIQAKPNPNLLDNWYFGNPVNQRGDSAYIGGGKYTIDRWWAQYDTGVELISGGIEISGKWDVQQYMDTLPEGTYTFSVLYDQKVGSDVIRAIIGRKSGNDLAYVETMKTSGLISCTAKSDEITAVKIGFVGSSDNSARLIAVKLEPGDKQTLAHQDENGNWVPNEIPDYGEQLRRCQRYFTKLTNVILNGMTNSGGTLAFAAIPLPAPMRAKPSVSSYSFNYGVAVGTKITSVSSAAIYGGDGDQSMFYAQLGASGLPGDTNFAAYMTDLALTADL